MNKYIEEAKAIRTSISGLAKKADDETLINNKDAFPYWNGNGVKYEAGFLVKDVGSLYQVIQPHTSQLDWQPSTTPALFKKVNLDEFPRWVQPTGAQDAYMKGDKCSHNGKHWISDVDNNVWEPSVYGWTEVEPNV